MLKQLVKKILNSINYDIVKIKPSKTIIGFNSAYLSTVCHADLIIDVGVGNGTHTLYRTFPNASILLVEPLFEEFSESLKLIQEQYSCELIGKALGSSEGVLEINFDPNRLTKASLFERTELSKNKERVTKKLIAITTLDHVLNSRKLSNKKVLLKIDAEGGELSILKGAKQSLQYVDSIIAEVSIAKRFENSYDFDELISFLDDQGFKLFSFLQLRAVKDEPRQRYADILFKKNKNVE